METRIAAPDDYTPAQRLAAKLSRAPLETERLRLRRPRADDAAAVFHGYAQDSEAMRWMGFRPHTSIATTERLMGGWMRGWEQPNRAFLFVIERAADGKFLGVIDILIDAHGALIGYILCRHAWGQGYATEAARRVVDLAFDHFGVWRVWATCAPQNPASRRVLEKAGMRHEGVLRRWIVSPLFSPDPRDSDCMAITRDDWLAERSRRQSS
jgi:ribosomal-protein-alanine N-acetyltransferase